MLFRLLVLAGLLLPGAGCMMNVYSSDPNRRCLDLINQSEAHGPPGPPEVERFWMIDQPSHLTPDRLEPKTVELPKEPRVEPEEAEKPPVVMMAVRVRAAALARKLHLSTKKGEAGALLSGLWQACTGVPSNKVKELTVYCGADEKPLGLVIRASRPVNRRAMARSCGKSLPFTIQDGGRSVVVGQAMPADLTARCRQEMDALGEADVVVWYGPDAHKHFAPSSGNSSEGIDVLALPLRNGFQGGAIAIQFGDRVKAAARLRFESDAGAAKAAKLLGLLLPAVKAELAMFRTTSKLADAIPEKTRPASLRGLDSLKPIVPLCKPLEKALATCRPVCRKNLVLLDMQADLTSRHLARCGAEFFKMVRDEAGGPGAFFASSDPNKRILELIKQSEDLRQIELEVERFWKLDQEGLHPVGHDGIQPASASEKGPPKTPAKLDLAVSNATRDEVALFRVKGGKLTFLQKVPPGEAIDLKVAAGDTLAATYSDPPKCADYTVKETEGQVWLLRPVAPKATPVSARTRLPREGSRPTTEYVIEPPDVLEVEAKLESPGREKRFHDEFLVRPDGTIHLPDEGDVFVAGMTVGDAQRAVRKHLRRRYPRPDVSVSLRTPNSKFYYVVMEGKAGDQVTRVPCTGKETVLDAIGQIEGLPALAPKKRIWVARPVQKCEQAQVLPVDWPSITSGESMATNYRLFSGDRVHVGEPPLEMPRGPAYVPPLWKRILELFCESEDDVRQRELDTERFWMIDKPTKLAPDRVHGGVGPSD